MTGGVLSWPEFETAEPELARAGHELLYEVGVGLAFLATVRSDGGPRVHPICPIVSAEGLFAFIVPSPKRRDLHRHGKYALHSFPLEQNEDAVYLTGRATAVRDVDLRTRLGQQFADERAALAMAPPGDEQDLFEFHIETAMVTRTVGHGDPAPAHTVWHAPGSF